MWYISLWTFFVLHKILFLGPISFYPNFFFTSRTFFSSVIGLQSRLFDFSKNRHQDKSILWVFWRSWKFARKRFYKDFYLELHFFKTSLHILFRACSEKLLFSKFRKIPRTKTSGEYFQAIWAFQSTTYNYVENLLHRIFFL